MKIPLILSGSLAIFLCHTSQSYIYYIKIARQQHRKVYFSHQKFYLFCEFSLLLLQILYLNKFTDLFPIKTVWGIFLTIFWICGVFFYSVDEFKTGRINTIHTCLKIKARYLSRKIFAHHFEIQIFVLRSFAFENKCLVFEMHVCNLFRGNNLNLVNFNEWRYVERKSWCKYLWLIFERLSVLNSSMKSTISHFKNLFKTLLIRFFSKVESSKHVPTKTVMMT